MSVFHKGTHLKLSIMSYFYVTSRLQYVFSTAERGMPAEYAFDQLMGFLDLLQFGRSAYRAGFPYIRGGNSPPPNVP